MLLRLTITEDDLIRFFCSNPNTDEPDVPWAYRVTEYSREQGNRRISFSIHPACREIHLALYIDGHIVFRLFAEAVEDVQIFEAKGHEQLEIKTSAHQFVLVAVLPDITIFQEMGVERPKAS